MMVDFLQTGLTGRLLPRPRQLVLLLKFGFEVHLFLTLEYLVDCVQQVDDLEIALREQADLVDKIFLVESTITHQGVGCAVPTHAYCVVLGAAGNQAAPVG